MSEAKRSLRRIAVATPQTNTKIYDMMLADRELNLREILEAIGMSHRSVVPILNHHLGITRLSVNWVPRLPIDHEIHRVTTSAFLTLPWI